MSYYLKTVEETLAEVDSGKGGLSSEEAARRLSKNGKNKLIEAKKSSIIQKFFESLKDPMIIMLLASAAISGITTLIQNLNGANESYTDIFIILFVVTLNTILGVMQEAKAEEAIDALKEMTAATSKVLRDNEQTVVKSEDIVVGDVVILEAGDAVPADCRILESYSLKLEEAALTGESLPVNKLIDVLKLKKNSNDIPLGDRKNMVYSGSTVAYGRGSAVVVACGMDTEMGKIATALNEAVSEETPLQKKMKELSAILTKLVIGICVLVFVFGCIREIFDSNKANVFNMILETFIMAVALAVAAIPEGLPAIVTVILSIGVTSMSKKNALIRKLTAVETLGCTQIICSDKTGTLTQNKMTVVDHFGYNEKLLATGMCLCSDSKIEPGMTEAIGEPTENALVNYAYVLGMPSYELNQEQPRVGEAPFDSLRKMMSTVHKLDDGYIQYTKGATEIVLDRSTHYLNENNEVVEMTEAFKKTVLSRAKEFADRALRNLGLAYRLYDSFPEDFEADHLEQNLVFVGFTGMIDPCRPEVYDAIQQCRKAGIRPVMITGDHIDTAVAIGKDLGIIREASQAKLGSDIDALSDQEMQEVVQYTSVFARVQPEHTTKIVKAFKDLGYTVAMTGDGVNDAPSIKSADIGVGMGITGTDVTKGVSDMVLADDNFATIVSAVKEGRKIYDNVRKVLQFQLSTNMSEVLVVFFASAFGIEILSPAHLLWINMVTDAIPGLALGMEEAEPDVMERKPRNADESVFADNAGMDMVVQGFLMSALVIFSYSLGDFLQNGSISLGRSVDGMTMAFVTCNFVEIFHCLCMRSREKSLFSLKTINWWLLAAVASTSLITFLVTRVTFFTKLFSFSYISFEEFMLAFGLAFLVIPIMEIHKAVMRKFKASRR